jgi:hypothetical protein
VLEVDDKSKLALGRVSLSPAADAALRETGVTLDALLSRHRFGDWGEMSDESKKENDLSSLGLLSAPIVSAYELPNLRDYIFVITDADQSETMVLLPDV